MWNKIIDPRNGKRVHVSSRRGMTVLRNYMRAQTGGHKGPCAVKSSTGRCGKSKASDGKCEVSPKGRCTRRSQALDYVPAAAAPAPAPAAAAEADRIACAVKSSTGRCAKSKVSDGKCYVSPKGRCMAWKVQALNERRSQALDYVRHGPCAVKSSSGRCVKSKTSDGKCFVMYSTKAGAHRCYKLRPGERGPTEQELSDAREADPRSPGQRHRDNLEHAELVHARYIVKFMGSEHPEMSAAVRRLAAQTGGHKGPCAVKSSTGRCGKSKASDGKCEVSPTGRCRKLASPDKSRPTVAEPLPLSTATSDVVDPRPYPGAPPVDKKRPPRRVPSSEEKLALVDKLVEGTIGILYAKLGAQRSFMNDREFRKNITELASEFVLQRAMYMTVPTKPIGWGDEVSIFFASGDDDRGRYLMYENYDPGGGRRQSPREVDFPYKQLTALHLKITHEYKFSEEKLKPEYLGYDEYYEHSHFPEPVQARPILSPEIRRYPMYSIEYAVSGRSKCKETGKLIPKGALRIGKWTKNRATDDADAPFVAWYRAACFFRMLKRARKHNTFDITTCDGVGKLRPKDVAWLTAEVAKHDAWLNMPKSERPKPPRKPKLS